MGKTRLLLNFTILFLDSRRIPDILNSYQNYEEYREFHFKAIPSTLLPLIAFEKASKKGGRTEVSG